MTALLLCAVLAGAAVPPSAADDPSAVTLRGRVVDAQTGEAIAMAVVTLPALRTSATTDAKGAFSIPGLPPGDVEIVVTTVGYGLGRKTVSVGATTAAVEIRVGQEALKRSEAVVVEAAPFDPLDRAAPAQHTLRGVELRNLASVLTDDPLRSVQSLPGVAAGDDFYASFASRGSGFASVGFYLDGVLVSAPVHTILDANDAYSLTILNGDVVDGLSFLGGGAPARYGDRTGAVLDVQTREGNREEVSGRASLGVAGLYVTGEGPFGRARKTSWLVSGRKSYVDYVLDRVNADSGTVLGFYDVTATLAHHLTATQTFALTLIHGRSKWRRGEADDPLSKESARLRSDLAILRWHHDTSALRLGLGAFASRQTGRNLVQGTTETLRSTAREWGLRSDVVRVLGPHRLEGGVLLRALGEQAAAHEFDGPQRSYRLTEDYDASTVQWGGYLQDTWSGLAGRLTLTLGARFDRFGETGEERLLPRASASFALGARVKAMAAFGDYAQFPTFAQLHGRHGGSALEAERSRHFTVGLERRLGERARLRVEAYDQEEDRLLFTPDVEWRLLGGRIVSPRPAARLRNALGGSSRGLELLLQRRSANGVSGWMAYTYGHARRQDRAAALDFDSDFDQRHTATVYASARLSETLNLSARFRYGSGFPVAGFFRQDPRGVLVLSEARNELRPAAYSRLDLRANKAWLFRGWKLTVFAELVNVLGRTNVRYTGLDGVDRTGRVFLNRDTLFPFLPSLGITVDF